jgi:cyclic di-GMP phosphodiesterase
MMTMPIPTRNGFPGAWELASLPLAAAGGEPSWNGAESPGEEVQWEAALAPILVVDDDQGVRTLLARLLAKRGFACRSAADGDQALAIASRDPGLRVVLLDIGLPGQSGLEVLRQLKSLDRWVEVVMVSGSGELDLVRRCLREGAYDYLPKPVRAEELYQTVSRALERGTLVEQNDNYRRHLEEMVARQTEEVRKARDVALFTLAKLAESRDPDVGRHLERIAEYSRQLARLLRQGHYEARLAADFDEQLFRSSPLHDVGKVAIPDSILLKPGPLTADEQAVMRTHATVGGDSLRTVIREAGGSGLLEMGMAIAYQHHERWDGGGYPAGLAGEEISLAARIVALVDAYDALTSRRPYKPAFDHDTAVERIRVDRGLHFDPVIADAFLEHHRHFQQIRSCFD